MARPAGAGGLIHIEVAAGLIDDRVALLVEGPHVGAERTTLELARVNWQQRTADDVRARTSGLRVQVVLLAVLVPGLALYLALTVPGMRETFTTPLGRFVLLPMAAMLETAGILASRRVVNAVT